MNLIKLLTPTNLALEKEKFFTTHHYHPQFTYNWENVSAKSWIETRPKYTQLYQSLVEQDYSQIVKNTSVLFATHLTDKLTAEAQRIVSLTPHRFPRQSIELVVEAFSNTFNFLDLRDYSIAVVDQHGFNFRPEPSQKRIVMSMHANFDFFSIDSEVKHELTHIIRYENGKHNNIQASHGYLPTEEGLATYCQDYAGKGGHVSLFQHAAEYAVTTVGLRSSLADMIDYLQDLGFSKELAWQRAIRHKFGWIDTAQPGDIMKPSMYFYHQEIIKRLTDAERYRLFVGKISVDELDQYPTYKGIIPLEKLQEFYQWKSF